MPSLQETRRFVTPYAFGVNESLIGKALARPLRRLLAILIDLLIVASLTLMSSTMLAASVFIVSLIGYNKARTREDLTVAPKVLIAAAIVSGLILLASFLIEEASIDVDGDPVEQVEHVEKPEVQDAEKDDALSDEALSIVKWVKAGLTDLGLGFGWAALYFSVFTSWFNGQTVGKMVFRIRVIKIDGKEMSLWEAFERYGGYSAGLATGLLGFLQIVWDPNRQAIHDKIAETMVIDLRKADRQQ